MNQHKSNKTNNFTEKVSIEKMEIIFFVQHFFRMLWRMHLVVDQYWAHANLHHDYKMTEFKIQDSRDLKYANRVLFFPFANNKHIQMISANIFVGIFSALLSLHCDCINILQNKQIFCKQKHLSDWKKMETFLNWKNLDFELSIQLCDKMTHA